MMIKGVHQMRKIKIFYMKDKKHFVKECIIFHNDKMNTPSRWFFLLPLRYANSNHYEVRIPVIFGKQFFLDKELYCRSALNKPRIPTEHPIDKAERFLSLMEKNKWTQAGLARHLGISRARVTQILNVLKITDAKIYRVKNSNKRITELSDEIIELKGKAISADDIKDAFNNLDNVWGKLVVKERTRLMHLIYESIIFHPENESVDFNLKIKEKHALQEVAV